jgi:hypothetical protein
MFVLVRVDAPDIVVCNENEAFTILIKNPYISAIYEYVQNSIGTWCISKRYRYRACTNFIVDLQGKWRVPTDYLTYSFPNICSICNTNHFMVANYCKLCNGDYECDFNCTDCDQNSDKCKCKYDDY